MKNIFKKQSLVISGVALFIGLTGTPAMATDMGPALNEYFQGNYASSLPKLRRLAREGNPEAQFALGLAYELGRIVNVNPIMAIYWYDTAARSYAHRGATIASRYSREAINRLHYKHLSARLLARDKTLQASL